jgi:hypothetical protein
MNRAYGKINIIWAFMKLGSDAENTVLSQLVLAV